MKEISRIIKRAPKPILHLHLDGSLNYGFIEKISKRRNISMPEEVYSQESLENWLFKMKMRQISGEQKVQKQQNWPIFDFFNQFLQHEEDIREAVIELCISLALRSNVNLLEIRFAPHLHTLRGLSLEQVIQSAVEGLHQARKTLEGEHGIKQYNGLILCGLRSHDHEKPEELVELMHHLKLPELVGFDLAGDEGQFELELHTRAFNLAKKYGINTTCHAGEWNEEHGTHKNLRLALELGIKRIGHGLTLRSIEAEIIEKYRNQKIGIEICLTSNCANKQKCESFRKHPLKDFLRLGLFPCAFNPDNLQTSGNEKIGRPDPETEILRAWEDCQLDSQEILQVIANGYKFSFIDQIPP